MPIVERGPDGDLWGRGAEAWLPAAVPGPNEAADVEVRRRLTRHWATLERETWRPLMARARAADADSWSGLIDWRCTLLSRVAEAVYCWAVEIEAAPARSQALRDGFAELRKLDREVLSLATQLAEQLRRRSELSGQFGISAEWKGPGLNLWDLIEATSMVQPFARTLGDPAAGLAPLLRYMRGTSRRKPALADLLLQVARSVPGEPVARNPGDAEVLRKGQGAQAGEWAERVRTLLAELEEPLWCRASGATVTALDCFSAAMLTPLARAAVGFDPAVEGSKHLTSQGMEAAMKRYRRQSRKGQPRRK